jgi:N-acetylneuraminic acid mutarotase
MTYDTATNRLLLFGGRTLTGTLLADLWAFDPGSNTWTELDDGGPSSGSGQSGGGPPPRMAHTLTYDPDTGNLVLVGGVAADGDTLLDDVWLYDDSGWTQVASDMPLPSGAYHQAIYTDNAIILVGNGEVWKYE